MRKSTKLRLAMAMVCFAIMAVNSDPALAAPPEGKGKKDQSVQVYDSSDPRQYLGILLGGLTHISTVEIFIPSSNRRVAIDTQTGLVDSTSPPSDPWYYTSNDCTGSPYTRYNHVMDVVYKSPADWYPYSYYMIESQQLLEPDTILFYTEWKEEGCVPQGSFYLPYPAGRVTEIPETDIPFTLPVTLPLQYEAQ